MKNGLLIVAAVALLWFVNSNSASGAIPGSSLDLGNLEATFVVSQDSLNRINSLYNAMVQNGLSNQQIYLMMSQILFESGMLTDVANYNLMNQNNYGGLTVTSGGYASYNSVNDFINAYIGFLTKGSNPLGATSLTDFVNRLYTNCYTGCPPQTPQSQYFNGLNTYYKALTNQ